MADVNTQQSKNDISINCVSNKNPKIPQEAQELLDTRITIGGEEYFASAYCLAQHSKVFAKMLTNGMKESKKSQSGYYELSLDPESEDPQVFQKFLNISHSRYDNGTYGLCASYYSDKLHRQNIDWPDIRIKSERDDAPPLWEPLLLFKSLVFADKYDCQYFASLIGPQIDVAVRYIGAIISNRWDHNYQQDMIDCIEFLDQTNNNYFGRFVGRLVDVLGIYLYICLGQYTKLIEFIIDNFLERIVVRVVSEREQRLGITELRFAFGNIVQMMMVTGFPTKDFDKNFMKQLFVHASWPLYIDKKYSERAMKNFSGLPDALKMMIPIKNTHRGMVPNKQCGHVGVVPTVDDVFV